ncbi:MAG: hypothetical protein GXY33_11115 [Phycisphaerae bacterium]|mgnify:CR=1 FL=1|nr:hypothetical protein [Phycisphaerae bacterium]
MIGTYQTAAKWLATITLGMAVAVTLIGCGTSPTIVFDPNLIDRVWVQNPDPNNEGTEYSFDADNNLLMVKLELTDADVQPFVDMLQIKNATYDYTGTDVMVGKATEMVKISGTYDGVAGTLSLNYQLIDGTMTVNANGEVTVTYRLQISMPDLSFRANYTFQYSGDAVEAGDQIDYETIAYSGTIIFQSQQQNDPGGTQDTTAVWELKTGDPLTF